MAVDRCMGCRKRSQTAYCDECAPPSRRRRTVAEDWDYLGYWCDTHDLQICSIYMRSDRRRKPSTRTNS